METLYDHDILEDEDIIVAQENAKTSVAKGTKELAQAEPIAKSAQPTNFLSSLETTRTDGTGSDLDYNSVRISAIVNGHEVPKMLLFLQTREKEHFGWQPYSFIQMKRFPKKAATVGFIATMGIASLVFGGYMGWLSYKANSSAKKHLYAHKITLSKLPPPPAQDANPIAPPPPTTLAQGPAARAGTPVPVPDALVAPDVKDFANIDQISRASAKGGDGVDTGILGLASDVQVEVREDDAPEMYDFIPVEKEPYLDIKELQRRVEYPEMARRANVQGKVLVRVLVSKAGIPVKSVIENSDSDLLDSAATRAIMKSVFTPAVQNSQPISCWVSIPVIFIIR